MPKCNDCGNTRSFGVSEVLPAATTANGPLTGIWVDFNESGEVDSVMSTRSEKEERDFVGEDPLAAVDICMSCGSKNIEKV